ncbi:MAG: TRM11 family SAM-dependent methyltransferase [Nanoarchaeota archaeon]
MTQSHADSYYALLDGDHSHLPAEEFLSLIRPSMHEQQKRIIRCDHVDQALLSRLAYTRLLLAPTASAESVDKLLRRLPERRPARFSLTNHAQKGLGSILRAEMRDISVAHEMPKEEYHLIMWDNTLVLCRQVWKNTKNFLHRRPHLRPQKHPASIHPKLARAAINCAGPSIQSVYDPMCGVGGIILEAACMGLDIHGSDIDPISVRKAVLNLLHYHTQGIIPLGRESLRKQIFCADAMHTTQKADLIITDIPYGISTRSPGDFCSFVSNFLAHAKSLTDTLCLIAPSFVDLDHILPKQGWIAEKDFTIYIHKSLTKKLYLLRQ